MKVFQVNSVCGIRSTGRIVTDIYNCLTSGGHQCKVAYGRLQAQNIDKKDVVKINGSMGVNFDGAMSRITGRSGEFSACATKKLIAEIEKFKPDVIHLHNLHGYYVNAFKLFDYLKSAGTPVVWTLHDCWTFTGHCAYFDRRACDKWKTGCASCPAKGEYPKSLFFDTSERQYGLKKQKFTAVDDMTVVTPCKWLKSQVEKSFLAKYPVDVINNGVSGDVFCPTSKPLPSIIPSDKPYVLGVAFPFTERKGFSDFIKLYDIIGEKYNIVMVGLDKKDVKTLPQGIIGMERTDSPEVLAALYSGAQCFVNLTYEDNFPTTNLESLMCGTPVVTYATGGSAECLTPTCGYSASKGNLDEIAEKIEKAVELKAHSASIAKESAARFDRSVMAQSYERLYKKILEKYN